MAKDKEVESTKLLWTQKKKLERETVFDEWTFPS